MKIYLVRHAKAGDRERWTKPDDIRPLTKAGWAQAEALAELLRDAGIEKVLSSHYARCVQTVEPLANALGLKVEHHDALVEGAPLHAALALISSLDAPAALCTHGDVMGNVTDRLHADGVPGVDPRLGKKGSTWVLELEDGEVTAASYLEPPA